MKNYVTVLGEKSWFIEIIFKPDAEITIKYKIRI